MTYTPTPTHLLLLILSLLFDLIPFSVIRYSVSPGAICRDLTTDAFLLAPSHANNTLFAILCPHASPIV